MVQIVQKSPNLSQRNQQNPLATVKFTPLRHKHGAQWKVEQKNGAILKATLFARAGTLPPKEWVAWRPSKHLRSLWFGSSCSSLLVPATVVCHKEVCDLKRLLQSTGCWANLLAPHGCALNHGQFHECPESKKASIANRAQLGCEWEIGIIKFELVERKSNPSFSKRHEGFCWNCWGN